MLKSLEKRVLWLTRLFQAALSSGRALKDWQIGMIIPIRKKADRGECPDYRGISLLSLRGKVNAKGLEKGCRKIIQAKVES